MSEQNVRIPSKSTITQMQIEADAERHRRDMGQIGAYWGSRENAATYLASGIIIVSLIAGTIIAICEPNLRSDAIKGLFGLAATALGFVIAGATKSK